MYLLSILAAYAAAILFCLSEDSQQLPREMANSFKAEVCQVFIYSQRFECYNYYLYIIIILHIISYNLIA